MSELTKERLEELDGRLIRVAADLCSTRWISPDHEDWTERPARSIVVRGAAADETKRRLLAVEIRDVGDALRELILKQAAEIEWFRRERGVLGDAIGWANDLLASDPDAMKSGWSDDDTDLAHFDNVREWVKAAHDLFLGGSAPHTTTYRQTDPYVDGGAWECTAEGCDCSWCLDDGTPSENNMRYCNGCGRRIVAEEPWEGDGDE